MQKKKRKQDKSVLFIGFDSEWVSKEKNYDEFEKDFIGSHNHVISYQYHAISEDTGKEWKDIIYTDNGKRIKSNDFLKRIIIQGLEKFYIKKWPTLINWVAHWTLADLATFSDFHTNLKKDFEAVRKSFISFKPTCETFLDNNRNYHDCKIMLFDTLHLSPQGKKKLSDLGEFHGLPKLELPPGTIEKMDKLLIDNPALFQEYALRDCEISLIHLRYIRDLATRITGKKSIPKTLGNLTTNYTKKFWLTNNINADEFLGLEKHIDYETGKPFTARTRARDKHEKLARETYHGGRNETYYFGATPIDIYKDYDLASAYTTVMALIKMLDYENAYQEKNVDKYLPTTMGYAHINFKFPKHVKYPCLPIRADNSLIFTLEGNADVCAPEIFLARKLGAEIEIIDGVIVPTKNDVKPFESLIMTIQQNRKNCKKGSLEEILWKEIGNTLYGKTAQGLGNRRVFNTKIEKSVCIQPCYVTNPYIASFITSFLRATISEIANAIPDNRLIINITTDGLITNANGDEMLDAQKGELCKLYKLQRKAMVGKDDIIEEKHQVAQVLAWRTRGQATIQPIPGKEIVLARAGIKPPQQIVEKEAQNQWILETFENRTENTIENRVTLRSLSDIFKKGGDLVKKKNIVQIGMEYDWKRKPNKIETRKLITMEHLAFDTVPWNNVDEYLLCRKNWENYRDKHTAILKTQQNLANFMDYASQNISKKGLHRSKKLGSVKLAIRQFLRAYVRNAIGLNRDLMTYNTLVDFLHKGGYQISINDVKNAIRQKLMEKSIVPTEEIQKFFEYVKTRFDKFDEKKLII